MDHEQPIPLRGDKVLEEKRAHLQILVLSPAGPLSEGTGQSGLWSLHESLLLVDALPRNGSGKFMRAELAAPTVPEPGHPT
jgi:acyl-CoA synthetase (AMP-forming)/AMP-acid ligase II